MVLPRLPLVHSAFAVSLATSACMHRVHGSSVDEACNASGTHGSAMIQQRSKIKRDSLLDAQGTCAPFETWPNIDNGVTCSPCGALVLTGPYGGRCDRYCESFGHRCVAAAEELDETCQVLENKRCNEEISGTSDMLCKCHRPAAVTCAAFGSWPNVDGGVTCSGCTALVLTGPYGGRCDRYCESFGHQCVAAAEEQGESCQVLERKRCDEEIRDTSDMLCTCQRSSPPAPTRAPETCYGKLPGLARSEGGGVGTVITQSESECRRACSANGRCQSASFCPGFNGCWLKDRSFRGGEDVRTNGDCRTLYKRSCDGGTAPPPRPTQPPRPPRGALRVKAVSYNIYWWNAFGQHPSKGRQITDNIQNRLRPDVLGLQECDSPSLIRSRTGYEQASRFSGSQGVVVKPGLFTVGDTGSRDIRATGKWGTRYVTWVQLTHRQSGRTFWVFNTHWCVHSGRGRTCTAKTRYTGARNMLQVIQERAGGAPVIITGDFNAGEGEDGPRHFLQNGYSLAKWSWVDGVLYSTAHWWRRSAGTGESAGSDHRPVIAELELK